jgi:hypothetical protein
VRWGFPEQILAKIMEYKFIEEILGYKNCLKDHGVQVHRRNSGLKKLFKGSVKSISKLLTKHLKELRKEGFCTAQYSI